MAAAFGNDRLSRLHSQALRDSQGLRQAAIAQLATDFLCALRNDSGMADEDEVYDKAWLNAQFERYPGATGVGLAQELGVDPSAVSKALSGKRGLKANEIAKIKSFFEKFEDDDRSGDEVRRVPIQRSPSILPTIEVRGTSPGSGSFTDSFRFEGGVVDRVDRLPALAHSREAYAIEVGVGSMAPQHGLGETLLIDPRRHPKTGEPVLVHGRLTAGQPSYWYIGNFVSRDQKGLVIRKLNPPQNVKFDTDLVEEVHKVLTRNEMLGR